MSGTLPSFYEPEAPHLHEFTDTIQRYKLVYDKYTKYKLLYESLEELIASNNLPLELKEKTESIFLEHRCTQIDLNVASSIESISLLGLEDASENCLNYSESIKLKEALKLAMHNKFKTVCDQFYKITGSKINSITETDSIGEFLTKSDSLLLDLKKKVEEQQKKYYSNLLEEQRVLENGASLRLEKVPEVCSNKVEECQLQLKKSELRIKLIEEKSRIDTFTETPYSLAAYEELMSDIKEQHQECVAEILHLHKLKEKYSSISCQQFDELLKTYNQYKISLAKIKLMYDSLHGKL